MLTLVTIKHNGVFHSLLNYFVPEEQNYIILESLNSIKENQYPLSVHILMFIDNSPYILGRGHESDVRISDISVSRSHARIYLKDKKFYLEDTGSKFGTLVLAKERIEIDENKKVLQIGRTLLAINEAKFENIINQKQETPVTKDSDFKLDLEQFEMPEEDFK
jgi:pSer/pThr/pTyr-binding forkhead associated (FHA) protein